MTSVITTFQSRALKQVHKLEAVRNEDLQPEV
jgi:hypothetical protein